MNTTHRSAARTRPLRSPLAALSVLLWSALPQSVRGLLFELRDLVAQALFPTPVMLREGGPGGGQDDVLWARPTNGDFDDAPLLPRSEPPRRTPETRFAIIGAGPAGLSTAYYLRQAGYRNVVVLEKQSRVGGMCCSITRDGRSFDLGANLVTPAYKEVLRVAKELGMELYGEGESKVWSLGQRELRSVYAHVNERPGQWTVWKQLARYAWLRWKLRGVLSPSKPGFAGVAEHDELCCSFADWLDANGLSSLKVVFRIPITLMGYGQLEEIPAAYALTYMSLPTFINVVMVGINPRGGRWPRRFKHGYARFFERLSWDLDVRCSVNIRHIHRGNDEVRIEYRQDDGDRGARVDTLVVDELIVAAPLYSSVVGGLFDDLTTHERELFSKVRYNPYCLTTFDAEGCDDLFAATYVLPDDEEQPEVGLPFVIMKPHRDCGLLSFYTRLDRERTLTRADVVASAHRFMSDVQDRYGDDRRISKAPVTHNEWRYFPHVSVEDFSAGFFDDLEALQGERRTWYVGGTMAFELIEPIFNYSKQLVRERFGVAGHVSGATDAQAGGASS